MKNIRLGTIIPGFAWGYFGRDSYEGKVCIATGVHGLTEWAIFIEERYSEPIFHIKAGSDLEELDEALPEIEQEDSE